MPTAAASRPALQARPSERRAGEAAGPAWLLAPPAMPTGLGPNNLVPLPLPRDGVGQPNGWAHLGSICALPIRALCSSSAGCCFRCFVVCPLQLTDAASASSPVFPTALPAAYQCCCGARLCRAAPRLHCHVSFCSTLSAVALPTFSQCPCSAGPGTTPPLSWRPSPLPPPHDPPRNLSCAPML